MMIINEKSLDFGLQVGQTEQYEDINLGSDVSVIWDEFLIFCALNN